MKICEFIQPEIDLILAEANFTDDERELFLKRTKDIPFERCAEEMNVSTATTYRVIKRVKAKIERIMRDC